MARLKNEMRKIHRNKIRKAKEHLKKLEKDKVSFAKMDSMAKKVFYKRLKAGYEFPAKIRAKKEPAKAQQSE